MPSFICKVITAQGQITKIKMNEEDKITCLKKIKKNGMTPISVEPSSKFFRKRTQKLSSSIYSKRYKKIKLNLKYQIKFSNSVKIEEIVKFTQDFYLLKKSKFTNKHALTTIVNTVKNKKFKDILFEMISNLDNGIYMYKTMKKYPDVFPLVYINIIKNGELNGLLDDSLEHAITFLEDEENIKNNIEKNIIPYLLVFLITLAMIFLSVLIGVPLIEDIFISSESNVQVPFGIKILFLGFKSIVKYWYILILGIFLIIFGVIGYVHTTKGRYKYDNFKYSNFLLGRLNYLIDFSKFIRCLTINIKSKIRFQDSLEVSKNVIDNTYMLNTIENSISNIYVGKSWVIPFEKDKVLNPITLEILKQVEKRHIDETLEKIIEYVDIEIEKEVKRIERLLPKISYSVIGIILILFLSIILIPCVQVYLGGFLFI